MFATAMQLGAARALLPDEDSPAAQRLLEAEQLTHMAQSELNTLIHEMRPVALEGKGLARALRELGSDWARQNNMDVQVRSQCDPNLPLLKEQALFRVAQEALSNATRHGQAKTVQITLSQENGTVQLRIRDDGKGFDPHLPHPGLGLRSMRERIEALGGGLLIESAPGEGARLVVTIPQES